MNTTPLTVCQPGKPTNLYYGALGNFVGQYPLAPGQHQSPCIPHKEVMSIDHWDGECIAYTRTKVGPGKFVLGGRRLSNRAILAAVRYSKKRQVHMSLNPLWPGSSQLGDHRALDYFSKLNGLPTKYQLTFDLIQNR